MNSSIINILILLLLLESCDYCDATCCGAAGRGCAAGEEVYWYCDNCQAACEGLFGESSCGSSCNIFCCDCSSCDSDAGCSLYTCVSGECICAS